MNQPEKCTSNTYKQTIGMVFGDDESTRLTSSGKAGSLNSLSLPLQVAEVEQYPLDKIYSRYMKSKYEITMKKGLLTSIQP